MKPLRYLAIAFVVALAGCETVSTQIVQYNPAIQYPPTQSVEVLLQKSNRPHVEIGLIEASGFSEAELLNTAREKARGLGADAIVKLETERVWHDPVPVYDPWLDPFYYGWYPRRGYPPFGYSWGTYPWPGPYRYIGGGYSYVLKATAIRYTDKEQ